MQKLTFFISCCALLFLVACKNETSSEKKLSDRELEVLDSISKKQQNAKVDSLKKKNPLLILPPDSNYTGDYTDKYPTGITKFKGFYRFGKRHGQWMSFYPNGLMWSEMFYDKGMRQGPNTTYFESGKVRYKGFYKNDKQDSTWSYYDSIGKLAVKVIYKADKIIKRITVE
jgi:antitoxin component YwqK of YwqJK toxin-antitoxin module